MNIEDTELNRWWIQESSPEVYPKEKQICFYWYLAPESILFYRQIIFIYFLFIFYSPILLKNYQISQIFPMNTNLKAPTQSGVQVSWRVGNPQLDEMTTFENNWNDA